MFTDIVGSTELVRSMGDEAWEAVLRWHDETLRTLIGTHRGEVVHTTGDGFFASFPNAVAAVAGAKIAALAAPSEVLVSQTVRDLVPGSGITFEDAGEHKLKGIPDRWRLYRLVG
jgi:class 3 adenylate cyclase